MFIYLLHRHDVIRYQSPIPSLPPVANAAAQQPLGNITAPPLAAGDPLSPIDVVRAEQEEALRASLNDSGLVTDAELGLSKLRTQAVAAERSAFNRCPTSLAGASFDRQRLVVICLDASPSQ